jgi:hypothetical protein
MLEFQISLVSELQILGSGIFWIAEISFYDPES